MTFKIVRSKNHPITIEREALGKNLSLSALGLYVHLFKDDDESINSARFNELRNEFKDQKFDELVEELTSAGLIDPHSLN